MKHIYKHGNQFWYQRAVPNRIRKLLGKKSIKISLKTNKLSIAIKRAKLQALEHKKMFFDVQKKAKNPLIKILQSKTLDIQSYEKKFSDDYEDLTSKLIFSQKKILLYFKNNISVSRNVESESLENLLFSSNEFNYPFLSSTFGKYLKIKNISPQELNKIKSLSRSVSHMIDICGDQPIDEYNKSHAIKFRDFFVKSNKISTGKRNQSNIQNIFTVMFDDYKINKTNPFSNLVWPTSERTKSTFAFNKSDLIQIRDNCFKGNDEKSLICALMFDTGCSFTEIIGLQMDDVYVSKFASYLIIRSNKLRPIKDIYKKRTIPLVGTSLWAAKKIKKSDDFLFKNYLSEEQNRKTYMQNLVNKFLKKLSNGKTSLSFKYSLIDRLKSIDCPEDIILEILGKSKKSTLYTKDYSLEIKTSWLEQIVVN